MWFEILPSGLIIYGSMLVFTWVPYFMHKLVLGTPYRRNLTGQQEQWMYLRNRRLSNNPYIFRGLETIKDGSD